MRTDKPLMDLVNKLLVAAFFSAVAIAAQGQSTARTAKDFKQVSISPDGTHVVWVESSLDADGEPTVGSAIYVEDLKSPEGRPRRISAKDQVSCDEDGVAREKEPEEEARLGEDDGRQSRVARPGHQRRSRHRCVRRRRS